MATLVQPPTQLASATDAQAPEQGRQKQQPWEIEPLVSQTNACFLRPLAFFVSWNGVLTLVYKGFPEPLRALKQAVNNNITSIARENPGSRWPKTSLGALKEGVRLTPQQLTRLIQICREESGRFQTPQSPKSQAVLVDQLEVVMYECRCLERALTRHAIPLVQVCDPSDPSPEECARVVGVVSEADDPNYWFHASRDGSREGHYRGNALGVTLVHTLTPFSGRTQPVLPFTHTIVHAPSAFERAAAAAGVSTGSSTGSVDVHVGNDHVASGASLEHASHAGSPAATAAADGTEHVVPAEAAAVVEVGSAHPAPGAPTLAAGAGNVKAGGVKQAVSDAVHGMEGAAHKAVGAVMGWWAKGGKAAAHTPVHTAAGAGTVEASKANGQGFGYALPSIVQAFRQRIDRDPLLAGMYVWFDDASLHVTIRALMG